MNRGLTGRYIVSTAGEEEVKAFVPNPLPQYSDLVIDEELRSKLDKAMLALGRLDSVATLLPGISMFLYSYVRKEAVLSSQIEGTQSSLSDLLIYESDGKPGVPINDVEEVSRYVAALYHGLQRIREGFPISLRLFREMHEILLAEGRGSHKDPGQFRRSQNWIGGTRPGNAVYVPPPADQVMACLDVFEKYLHDQPQKTPILIKIALAHVQFETIHPFLDGNGRLGRLLITLLLCNESVLGEPLLYLSLFFKQNRTRYYDLLNETRLQGDWESWLIFFLNGVMETADGAVKTAKALMSLVEKDRKQIQQLEKGGQTALRVHRVLEEHLILSIQKTKNLINHTTPTVVKALKTLEEIGIVKEITGKQRGRMYAYEKHIELLNQGV